MTDFTIPGLRGTIIQQRTPSIVQGEDAFIIVQISYGEGKTRPYPFNSLSGASAYFKNTDGTTRIVTGSEVVYPGMNGQLRFDVAASGTSGMYVGERMDFQVDFRDGTGLAKILMSQALTVSAAYY